MTDQKTNPFKPGAGHSPPHLAGREHEQGQFLKLLEQGVVTQNIVLTGLRGVGKTVLMDDIYKPIAAQKQWVWVGSDFSESAFVDEQSLCLRLLTDLSLFTAQLTLVTPTRSVGYRPSAPSEQRITFEFLMSYFDRQPGLMTDKLKATLEFVWDTIQATGKKGVLFAYDESQVVQDRKDKDQYPLALMLEVFQSIQRKGMRYMLLLTGLPTLFQKLVEARTYAERMFVVQDLGRLDVAACREAITRPLAGNAISFDRSTIEQIVSESKRYPYFVQYICREAYDYFKTTLDGKRRRVRSLPIDTVIRKLDADFFSGRWNRSSDRQREMLLCIASLKSDANEFAVSEIVEVSRKIAVKHKIKPFKTGDVSQMLPKLIDAGLVFKNRYGKYSLAVPLFDAYILRQFSDPRVRKIASDQ